MSRIGKNPIVIPEGLIINIDADNQIIVKGRLGELKQKVHPDIRIKVEGSQILVSRPSEQKIHKSMHGLYRSLINNMVEGVSKGFETKQVLIGVGYRATVIENNILELVVGHSHNILFQMPQEIQVEAVSEKRQNPVITLKSFDKQLLGQVAAKIRSLRPPEPYKGKGILFVNEKLRRKAGKTASS